ncbi:interleukin-18 receptor accessory protein-like isoform X2 [Eleginops maclovinus]|uniref:interleukin-18 receptor accessory protein-like isoform X2 n=1 Tax=Eleginops maclovinus TaxID=56733 RepID=UPI00307FFD81
MQAGYILVLLILPIFLEGCCRKKHQVKITAVQWQQHYRAMEGEIFMMPCIKSSNNHKQMVWSRTGKGSQGNQDIPCERNFTVETKHSGNYSSGSKFFLYLHVVEKASVECFKQEESSVVLELDIGGKVPCPGVSCRNNTDVIWYQGHKPVSVPERDTCVDETGQLHLCVVYREDTGVYYCDRKIIEQGHSWTFRRAVSVRVAPEPVSYPPRIPKGNMTQKVELGQPHTLVCEVFFPTEKRLLVQWYINYGGNLENMTLLPMEEQEEETVIATEIKVSRSTIIEKVTLQHLNHTYTCIAINSVGNSSVTIKLKEKTKDEKEFDVFLSFVRSPSANLEGALTISLQEGPYKNKEACLSSMDLLYTEEGRSTLEVLLPQVLEDQWGYRLCLLERDILPGGAYTNDVVLAISKSQMLICVLSADYLSNSNAVFVLESGIKALLQNNTLKLLLIWTTRDSAALVQQDPPLPALVQRALKVLPSLDWSSGKTARTTSSFWRSLRKAIPSQRVNMVSLMQGQ